MTPSGDQPEAITSLVEGLEGGARYQTLLGITGSGKSFTLANVIAKAQRPTLVLAPNKSLAAQLAAEFREFFPHNRVEYFVSYYDYYQPEAYIPSSDTYIEKDSSINDEIDRLRHSATSALLTRRDVIIVASVSAIYGLGSPEQYQENLLQLNVGDAIDQRDILARLVDLQYERNDFAFQRNKFRVRGDTIEVFPAYEEQAIRISMFGDEVERICIVDPLTGELVQDVGSARAVPGVALRHEHGTHVQGDRGHRGGAAGAPRRARGEQQAARGAAPAHAHPVRPRDDARGGVVQRHRELLPPPRRSHGRAAALHPARLLPRRLRDGARRVARRGAAAAWPVRGRPQPQGHARGARLPAAERARQPAAALRGVLREGRPGDLHVGDPGRLRATGVDAASWSRSCGRPACSTPR